MKHFLPGRRVARRLAKQGADLGNHLFALRIALRADRAPLQLHLVNQILVGADQQFCARGWRYSAVTGTCFAATASSRSWAHSRRWSNGSIARGCNSGSSSP